MNLLQILQLAPVLPVLVIEDERSAVPLAKALCAGGLRVLEVTLRTPAAISAIERIVAEVEDVVVGAGTVTNRIDLDRAAEAGARFAVSPGLTPDLAVGGPIPLLPGAATATEIMRAREAGFDLLKFFPAVPAGGVNALRAFAGPFPEIRFCPTGGIDADNAASFLALPNVICVGGSWVTPANAVRHSNWEAIRVAAHAARRP
jgi:2-dehydro-3-deoxyphosphogluconate aldolase/(4S)-4-hydroxy-2-oxoglutarate aldolase